MLVSKAAPVAAAICQPVNPCVPKCAGGPPDTHISLPALNGGSQMKPIVFAILLCASILAALPAPSTSAFTPDQIQFGAVPPFLSPGAQLAVLEGDPTASAEITPSV